IDNSYNQHMHVLVCVESTYFYNTENYVNQKQWIQFWKRAMKLDYDPNVKVQMIRPKNKHKSDIKSDRKSTRLNSSHDSISYTVLCLKKKSGSTDRGLLLRGLGNAGSNVFGRALECARLRAVLIRRGYRLQAGHSTIACRRIEQSGLD